MPQHLKRVSIDSSTTQLIQTLQVSACVQSQMTEVMLEQQRRFEALRDNVIKYFALLNTEDGAEVMQLQHQLDEAENTLRAAVGLPPVEVMPS